MYPNGIVGFMCESREEYREGKQEQKHNKSMNRSQLKKEGMPSAYMRQLFSVVYLWDSW